MPTATELKNELNTDPQTLGYSAAGWPEGPDQAVADFINDPAYGATIWRTNIPMSDVYAEVDWSEVIALGEAERQVFRQITSTAELDADSQNIRDAIGAIFGAGTTTRANLLALVQKSGSRAEELWGDGVVIQASDVGRAANA